MARNARHKARVLALQTLYEWDAVGHDPLAALARERDESQPDPEVLAYARELVERVVAGCRKLDARIQPFAPAWPIAQIHIVDRNILRIALCEITLDLVPPKVAINEAVEMAKAFGGEGSPRFVNGALGGLLAEVRR